MASFALVVTHQSNGCKFHGLLATWLSPSALKRGTLEIHQVFWDQPSARLSGSYLMSIETLGELES